MFYQSKFLLVVCIMLVFVPFEVLAHDTSKIRDGSQTHTLSTVWSDGEGHWHEDADGTGASNWDDCVADAYDPDTDSYNLPGGRCADELPSTPEPEPSLPEPELITLPPDPTPIIPTPQPEDPAPERPTSDPSPPTPESDSPRQQPERPRLRPRPSTPEPRPPMPQPQGPVEFVKMVEDVVEDNDIEVFEVTEEIKIPELPVELPVPELVQWEYQFWKGWNLMSFSVLPLGVETVSDLYHEWDFFAAHNADIVVNVDGAWLLYDGTDESVAGEVPLSVNLGMAVRLDWGTYLGVRGISLPNAEIVDLRPGVNLIGFSDSSANVRRPSDFLSDTVYAVVVTREGKFYLVGRAGDSGDELLESGQAVILVSAESGELDLVKSTPSAPSARGGTLVTSWGAMK